MSEKPEEARLETSYAEVTMLDEATVRAGFELLRPLFDYYEVYDSIETQHVQSSHEDSTAPDNPNGIHTDDDGLDSNLAIKTDYSLDHENPYHLQWAYEQADCSIGQAAEYFDVSKTIVRENLAEAGIHDPESVNGPAGYRDEETLRETFESLSRDIKDTADEFNVSTKTIRNWLNRHDIDIEPPWQDEDRLEQVYTENDEVVEWTADEFGASPSTVRRWLRRFDLLNGEEPPEESTHERVESEEEPTRIEEESQHQCEECGRDDFDSERAKNIHKTRTHGKDDEEESPGPVEPPEDDELSEDGFDIDKSEIRSVDISEYGYPYTTGNVAAIIARRDNFYDIGDELEVSRAEAHRLCERIGVADRIAGGGSIEEAEVRERLKIATGEVATDGGTLVESGTSPTIPTEERVGPPVSEIGGIWDLIERMAECETTEDWSWVLADYIQWGNNTKVHKSVAVFNMNAAHDCVNRGTERCQVDEDECYAVKDERTYNYVLDYDRRQEYLWDCLDADTWADAFLEIVERKYTEVSAVKFSQAGDFRHDSDIIKVNRIAERLAEHDIPVFTYSASSHLNWDLATAFTVNQSNELADYGDGRYRVVRSVDEIEEDEVHCPFDKAKREGGPKEEQLQCGECKLCIRPDTPDVAVVSDWEEPIHTECPNCGHQWGYQGKRGAGEKTTCPRCQSGSAVIGGKEDPPIDNGNAPIADGGFLKVAEVREGDD